MGVMKKLQTSRMIGVPRSGVGEGAVITGDKELMKMLKRFRETAARRVNVAGCKASAQVLTKAAKAEVPSNMKKAKQGLGWRVLKVSEARDGGAKVGGKVGRTAKKASKQNAKLKSRSGKRGVGISGANIHWLFLGAGEPAGNKRRHTGKSGGPRRDTGNMEPVIRPMMAIAAGQRGAMQSAYKVAAKKQIEKEVKAGKAF